MIPTSAHRGESRSAVHDVTVDMVDPPEKDYEARERPESAAKGRGQREWPKGVARGRGCSVVLGHLSL